MKIPGARPISLAERGYSWLNFLTKTPASGVGEVILAPSSNQSLSPLTCGTQLCEPESVVKHIEQRKLIIYVFYYVDLNPYMPVFYKKNKLQKYFWSWHRWAQNCLFVNSYRYISTKLQPGQRHGKRVINDFFMILRKRWLRGGFKVFCNNFGNESSGTQQG